MEKFIINSRENSIFGIDYYFSLYLRGKYPYNIEIIEKNLHFENTVIEFVDNSINTLDLANKINNQINFLTKTRTCQKIIESFFGNPIIGDKIPVQKQIETFYLLWIILLGTIVIVIFLKICGKPLLKYLAKNVRSHFRTMDVLTLRKNVNMYILRESDSIISKLSRESVNVVRLALESFLKRQFFTKRMIKETKQQDLNISNIMLFSNEIQKHPYNIAALNQAYKCVKELEENKYYESDKFLKKRKRRISVSKKDIRPGFSIVLPVGQGINLKKNEEPKGKNRTLYDIILENITKTISDKNEKKLSFSFNFRGTLRHDTILEDHSSKFLNNKYGYISRRKSRLSNKQVDIVENRRKSIKQPPSKNFDFQEDDEKGINYDQIDEKKRNSFGNQHNLPYISSSFHSLINSENRILENFKAKMMKKEKEKISDIEEEDKENNSGNTPMSFKKDKEFFMDEIN